MDRRFKENIAKLQEDGDGFDAWFVLDEDTPQEGTFQCICTKRLKYAYPVIHRKNGNQIMVGGTCLTKFNNSYKKVKSMCEKLGKKYQVIPPHDVTEYVKECILQYVSNFSIEKYEAIMQFLLLKCPIRELLQPKYEQLKQAKVDMERRKLEAKYKHCYCCPSRGIYIHKLGTFPVCNSCFIR
jgi:hypothetical protein